MRTKGAAQSDLGFHRYLAEFVGWKLPQISRFDGERVPLYLECLFPYFFVDQLSGWREVKARMPTYLQIPDMAKRSAEYILSLDILRISLARLALREVEESLKKRWQELRTNFKNALPRIGLVLQNLPEHLPEKEMDAVAPRLLVKRGDDWVTLEEHVGEVRQRLEALKQSEIPTTAQASVGATTVLRQLEDELTDAVRKIEEQQVEMNLAQADVRDVETRLEALREDYRQYDEDRRLRDRGGKGRLKAAEDTCPTCGQHIDGTLMTFTAAFRPMSSEENLAFLRDQIATFREMRVDAIRTLEGKEQSAVATSARVTELSAQLRAQKEQLSSRNDAPSVAAIQERLLLESRVIQLELAAKARSQFEEALSALKKEWKEYEEAYTMTGEERLTDADLETLRLYEKLFIEQLHTYDFQSYEIDRISIDRQTYRPSYGGLDLGITSASDAVRAVWAYLLGMLETARTRDIHHPGFLIFDEPKQQMVKDLSFQALMTRAATSQMAGQQVIFATSQPTVEIERMLQGHRYTIYDFTDRIIARI